MWSWLRRLFGTGTPPDEDDDSKYPDDGIPEGLDCPDTEPTAPGALGEA
jgi:hypothetical protein